MVVASTNFSVATPKPGPRASKLDGLQAGRAIAALLVVAFHANVFILPDKLYGGATAGPAFNMGYAGVEFFFVLSGFIMYYIHAKDFGVATRAGTFLRRRILRIYPIYWVVLIGLLGLWAVTNSGPENAFDPFAIVTSLFLIPTPDFPIMRVAWTLIHEMLFYIVFVAMIFSRGWGTAVFAAWMVACVAYPLSGGDAYPLDVLLSAYNLLFLFGIIAAMLYQRLSTQGALVAFSVGVLIFFGVGLSESVSGMVWDHAIRTWCYGVGAAMIAAALAAGVLASPRWLTFLGDASYSIYLVHLPVMLILATILTKLGAPWGLPPLGGMAMMIALSIIAGCVTYLVFERPLMRFFSKREKRAV